MTATPPPGKTLESLVDPFVALHDRAALSRVLLAEVVGPDGRAVLPVALKLQSDEYPFLPDGASSAWNNVVIEEAWEREAALLERCDGAREGLPAIVEVLARAPGKPAHLPPTLFCKRREVFFAIPCPRCGGALADCRDARALEALGLPRFDLSLARFLACPACSARGETRLWTLVGDRQTAARDVGDQADLIRALGRLARTPARSDEQDGFACQGCEHVPACHPDDATARGDALRLLTPVTFYESCCLGLEPLHLRYDEFAALAGGASFDAVVAGVTEPGRVALLRTLEPRFTERAQYLFTHDPAGKLGLEVLRLKLTLFQRLCAAVAALHRHARAPHLGLAPGRVLVRSIERTGLPNLWSFAVTLVGLGNARPRLAAGGTALGWEPPRLVDPVYAAEPLRAVAPAEQPCTVTVRALQPAPGGQTTLDLELVTESVDLAGLGDKDLLELAVTQGRPPLSVRLMARATGIQGRGARLRTLPALLDAETRAALEQLVDHPLGRARLSVWPCVDVPCDVHALGMLLLVALVGGPAVSPAALAGAIEEIRRQIVAAARTASSAAALGEEAARIVARAAATGPFARTNLFADPEAHARAAASVPDALWVDALLLGFRAASTIRGFSVCRNLSDFDPGHPEVKAEFLLQLVDTTIRRVDAALFGLPGRTREIDEALARVARELEPSPKGG